MCGVGLDVPAYRDQEFSCEVLPATGVADPSFRYVLFARCFEPEKPFVLMVPRGSSLADNPPEHLINLEEQPRTVEASFYRDLVSTCARACLDTNRNRIEILEFG